MCEAYRRYTEYRSYQLKSPLPPFDRNPPSAPLFKGGNGRISEASFKNEFFFTKFADFAY
jgi:hypothetical protein